MSAGRLVLVDAHSLIFQVFHAIRQPMTSPDGRPTNAVYGFTRDLFDLRDMKPDYLVVAFDLAGPTFRSGIDKEYKAQRPPPPDDLILQFPIIEQVVKTMSLPALAVEGYEADDILATLAVAGRNRGLDVTLVTTDKDCRQLLGDNVRMFNLRKQSYLDPAGLMEDWGVRPEQVIDYQSLVGDSVDNVKGVPGVGAKTASKLLQQFGSLDNLLARADEVQQAKIRDALKSNGDRARLSRQLVKLATDVPLTMDWDAWKLRDWDGPALSALFQQLGFRTFAQRAHVLEAPPANGELFPSAPELPKAKPVEAHWVSDYRLIDTPELFADFLKRLKEQKRFAFDLETTNIDPLRCDIVGIAVCWKATEAYYLPLRGPIDCKKLDPVDTLSALKPIFADPAIGKVNQNIKYDMLALRKAGVEVGGVVGDSMVADYLLHAGERSHGLDDMARRYLNHQNISITELIGKKGKKQLTMDQVPTDKVSDYAAEDADVAWRLTELLEADLPKYNLRPLYDEMEIPLISVLADVEATGIRLDVEFLRKLSAQMEKQLETTEAQIHELAGRPFNIASLEQLRVVLFDEMKLPMQKKTSITQKASTDQETLEKLAELGFELPKKIIEYRQTSKLKSTYVDALPALVHPDTGRLHTSFNQTVASTGRLSSSDPNLQNIPMRTDQGREIRQAFRPRDGWQLVTADYSQIELRLLAHCCGDENLKQAFVEDRDIHASVAAQIFHVDEKDVTSDQRRAAKTVNFGIVYGMSPHGLAQRLGISRDEATTFIDNYFARFPSVLKYQSELLARCHRDGFVQTLMGRRRTISGVRANQSYKSLNQPEREAINMEIQGSAADMMKKAMLNIHARLGREKFQSKMLLSVHDELVFESPPDELAKLIALVRHEMTAAMPISVPVTVDVASGPNWLEVEEAA